MWQISECCITNQHTVELLIFTIIAWYSLIIMQTMTNDPYVLKLNNILLLLQILLVVLNVKWQEFL